MESGFGCDWAGAGTDDEEDVGVILIRFPSDPCFSGCDEDGVVVLDGCGFGVSGDWAGA